MYTQCPNCQAVFQISAEQLKAAAGDVRCGQCLTVFNALQRLSEEVPEQASTELNRDASDYSQWAADTPAETVAPPSAVESTAATDDSATTAPPAPSEAPEAAKEVQSDDTAADVVASSWSTPPSPATAEEQHNAAMDTADDTPSTAAIVDHIAVGQSAASDVEPVSAEDKAEAVAEPLAATAEEATPDLAKAADDSAQSEEAELDSELEEVEELGEIGFVSVDLENEGGNRDENEFAEITELAEPMNSGEAIIIEDQDLAPMSSQDYRDDLSSEPSDHSDQGAAPSVEQEPATLPSAEQTAETVAAAEDTATERTEPEAGAEAMPTRQVPAVILDELQAAKAERLRPSNTPWLLGTVFLMLTLALQMGYYSRDDLARDPTLRPWMIKLCRLTGCTLSQPYDISLIDIIGRDVRTHPTARKALIASTTLINNAPFVQPYPLLTLVFSDITGTELARRRFTPREYLSSDIDIAAGMTPDTPVRIELELVDPGKAAVNYEFHAELDPRIKRRPLT